MDLAVVATELGDGLLRPNAEHVDVHGVPRSHVEALATSGLLGIAAPTQYGGSGLDEPAARRVAELLAAADTSTWFVWTQHHTPVRTIARGDNGELKSRLLPDLASGRKLAAVAYTHLRRAGQPPVRAERDGGGWRISGDIAWLTSWGLADVVCLAALAGADVVWWVGRLSAGPRVAVEPLALAAMAGTHTVRVRLDGLTVDDADVALVEPLDRWRAEDAERVVGVSPAVVGVTAEAIERLRSLDPGAAAALDRRLVELRSAVEDGRLERRDRLALRADAHRLSLDATAALVAVHAGRAMSLDHAAQRLARTAMFLLVQGQTADVRAATVSALAR